MQNWKRRFFTVWIGQAVSLTGSGLVQFALVWWLTQQFGSATVLAMATLAAIVPEVVFGPFAGALVDRFNRKTVMILADGGIAAATLLLAGLFATGLIQPWHVYAILFLRSCGSMFHFPAMQASTSLMVPKDQLTRIAGLNQLLRGILNIATPPLGALLITLVPMYGVVAVDVVTALVAILPLLFIAIPRPERVEPSDPVSPRSVLRDVRVGLAYVRARPGLVAILMMAMLINFLFVPAGSLTPLLVTKHFSGGAWHLSLIESVAGFGVVAGSLLLSTWGGFKRQIVTSMSGLVGMGLGGLLVGIAPSDAFLLAVVGNALLGFFNPITNGPFGALLQTRVDPAMQGRVMTLISAGCAAMMPLGTLLAAPVADLLGIQVWFIAAGAVTALMGLAAFSIPVVMNIERDMPVIGEQPAAGQMAS